jgi:hypothetical protein
MEGLREEARVIEELDVSQPPDLSMAVQCLMDWAAARRTRELAVTTKQATCVNYFRTRPLGEEPELHGYLTMGLYVRRLPRKVTQSLAKFRLSRHKLRIETGRHKKPRNQEKIGYAQDVGSYRKTGRQVITSTTCTLIVRQLPCNRRLWATLCWLEGHKLMGLDATSRHWSRELICA